MRHPTLPGKTSISVRVLVAVEMVLNGTHGTIINVARLPWEESTASFPLHRGEGEGQS